MNRQLARYLQEKPEGRMQPSPLTHSPLSYHARAWRVRDRLSEQEIATIVAAFKAGTAKHVLAKRFGLAERSLKKLLREEGVKRRSWNDVQA